MNDMYKGVYMFASPVGDGEQRIDFQTRTTQYKMRCLAVLVTNDPYSAVHRLQTPLSSSTPMPNAFHLDSHSLR